MLVGLTILSSRCATMTSTSLSSPATVLTSYLTTITRSYDDHFFLMTPFLITTTTFSGSPSYMARITLCTSLSLMTVFDVGAFRPTMCPFYGQRR
ncbi:hypothetical protein BDN72DRAFT_851964 [Pluteus cervinus]|uniref:Uncharacterized protein n=1 Tax=Pluteus cervinus TaxID=181527 RepID=A0ACD2ZX73_9AGAR|nr:hypothetical protein BDN72DRAFT_851964 [Pluteus cervinus]